ncbi:1-acyl-sn-glycerol-3-phosphate acyltransferase [Luminiphilus sp.]|jgi:hypothetical protein|nr:1-acyl-sn-glycerol-3-phosphate acyltransferase [Luminiphilus sp.]MDA9579842.1 1-acyl-sn-glycerol-3-phosphate acyltransferase [Luminiphilus sp.]MDB2377057.1 1-acyl-sn-glycerol-3-phosphate acyltransferase [Luminiphilus sp.]MDB2616224.1 1-acyl-sn-glycerol-3-phosphate acyltransferase [Luminiphilus sp.]
MNDPTDPYADIRPYRDDEVARVLQGLRDEPGLINTLAEWKLGPLYRFAPTLARALAKTWLGHRLKPLTSVDAVQIRLRPLLADMVAKTVRLSSDGLESLDPGQSWLFVSNHRDITMDPALTNHILYDSGHRTLAIAIGDNLLKERWVADLMRLNKSFIVKRALSGPRELLGASRQLAGFIRAMITTNQGPVWIAQREGRAKDGIDTTEPAVIKMLSLARDRKTETIADVLPSLKIVPVAIAYELDPCDASKAAELAAGAGYVKSEQEDVLSIGQGITGQKGCVHLSFGAPLLAGQLDVSEVVTGIDTHIRCHYRLFETALWAWQQLEQTDTVPAVTIYPGTISRDEFDARINAMPIAHRPLALAMYANPLRRALGEH